MNWKWWFLLIVSIVLSVLVSPAWAGEKKEKEIKWPPMPQLDSLPGDTSGAITIRDSALVPTFGIYSYPQGEVIHIDSVTFKKYGLVVFFSPYDELSRKYIEYLSEIKHKIENEWDFQVFLVMARKTFVSCREVQAGGKTRWMCRTFLMPGFKGERNSEDSLKAGLAALKSAFPVYRLKQPLGYEAACYLYPVELFAKGPYVVDIAAKCKSSWVNRKQVQKTFADAKGFLKKWNLSEGGDKK